MSLILLVTVASAAIVFIATSATMNALFLASLGRTFIEVGVLAAVSIASDVVKAVLPVVMVRAVSLQAWTHGTVAGVMLVVVIALSLASGTGFAALTRSTAVAGRDAQADKLAARQKELTDIEVSIAALAPTRQVAVIEAAIAGAYIDRRWAGSKFCSEITSAQARKFCSDLSVLRSELATATTRDRLTAERRDTRAKLEALRAAGAGVDSDPQAAAIAALLGVDTSTPRRVLTVAIAVVLELGSVILVLLAAGPTVRGWHEPSPVPAPVPLSKPVTVTVAAPHARDVIGWQLRRNKANLSVNRGGGDER